MAEAPLRHLGTSFFSPHSPGPPRLQAHWLTGRPGLSFAYCMPVGWLLWGNAASSSILAPRSLLHELLGSRKYERTEDILVDGVARIKNKAEEENGKPLEEQL